MVPDSISSFTTLIGVLRTGFAIFPISTRNSVAALVHLISKTGIDYIIVGPEAPYQKLARDAFKQLKEQGHPVPQPLCMSSFEELYRD